MLDIMARLLVLSALSTLILAHMQMLIPSPLRDPHANRANEPKDYNILQPLHADVSDFACKGWHLNTPWTTVATYEAGGTYDMTLKGSVTHGGGSCQLSMSFDGGSEFKIIQSMEGGCPINKRYRFKIPKELGKGRKRSTGLFAWTWFNEIGNREMYMNCAVVDVVRRGSLKTRPSTINARDTARANAVALRALASYPSLFVANLKSVNSCVTKEMMDVVFDDPGKTVDFADGENASAKPSFTSGQCTGRGSDDAGNSVSSSSSPPGGQWQGSPQQFTTQSNSDPGNTSPATAPQQQLPQAAAPANNVGPEDVSTGTAPSAEVESELQAYLAQLYGSNAPRQRRDTTPDASPAAHCAGIKRDAESCTAPNRWTKRDACTWSCERRGRAISSPQVEPNDEDDEDAVECEDDEPEASSDSLTSSQSTKASMITEELETLQSSIAKLLQAAENRKHSRRQDPSPDADTPSNFDPFLLYLARLQTSVVECIRAVAAAIPDTISNDTASTLTKRGEAETTSPQGDMLSFIFAQNGDVGQVATQAVEQQEDVDADMGLNGNGTLIDIVAKLSDHFTKAQTLTAQFAGFFSASTSSSTSSASLASSNSSTTQTEQSWHWKRQLIPSISSPTTSPATLSTTTQSPWSTFFSSFLTGFVAAISHPSNSTTNTPLPSFPYFLAPGPALPSGLSLPTSPKANSPAGGNLESMPSVSAQSLSAGGGRGRGEDAGSGEGNSNLESMPALVDDFAPGDDERVREWFVEHVGGGEEGE